MLMKEVAHIMMAAIVLWNKSTKAASMPMTKLCGRELSEFMSRVCYAYNSPSWDVPTVVEQQAVARKKRQAGIADECCAIGCTWLQLTQYCSIIAYSESPLDMDHKIEDRSAEVSGVAKTGASAPQPAGGAAKDRRREGFVELAARTAPVVGTVSPLITWGRILNTDFPTPDADRYAYGVVRA